MGSWFQWLFAMNWETGRLGDWVPNHPYWETGWPLRVTGFPKMCYLAHFLQTGNPRWVTGNPHWETGFPVWETGRLGDWVPGLQAVPVAGATLLHLQDQGSLRLGEAGAD